MYIFLAAAALYTLYIFHTKYFKLDRNKDIEENYNDGYLDENKQTEIPVEPKEIELIEQSSNKENDEFLDDDKIAQTKEGWFW